MNMLFNFIVKNLKNHMLYIYIYIYIYLFIYLFLFFYKLHFKKKINQMNCYIFYIFKLLKL
jgi:predicted permease